MKPFAKHVHDKATPAQSDGRQSSNFARRLKREGRHLKRHARHTWERYLKWPAPLWRGRGYANVSLEGEPFRFRAEDMTMWWLRKVARGKWERHGTAFMRSVLRPGDVFIDVGAWAGPYSLLAARLVGPTGRVFAFEPDPVARRLLRRNVAMNHASNVTVVPCAVTDNAGRAWLGSSRLGDAQSAVAAGGGVVEVRTVSLAGFCEEHEISPALLKIDVEGGEAAVLAGAGDVLRNARGVILEVHDPQMRAAGVDPDQFRRRVDDLGMEATLLHARPEAGNTLVGLRSRFAPTPDERQPAHAVAER